MSWRAILHCVLCGATEHLTVADGEAAEHSCKATTIGEGLVSL